MKDIFEIDDAEFDPILDKLVMNNCMGNLAVSLFTYDHALRNGVDPEEAYSRALSPKKQMPELGGSQDE